MFAFEVKNTALTGTVTTLGWLKPLTTPKWSERFNSIGGVTFEISYKQFKEFFLDVDSRWIHIQLMMLYKASTYNPTINLYPMSATVDHNRGIATITLAFSTIIATYKRISKNRSNTDPSLTVITAALATLEDLVTDPSVYSSVSRAPWDSDYNAVYNTSYPQRYITGGETVYNFISRTAQTFRMIFGFGWATCSPNQALANAYNLESIRKTRWGVQAVGIDAAWLTWKRTYQALNIRTRGTIMQTLAGVNVSNDAMLSELFTQKYDFTKMYSQVVIQTEGPDAGLMNHYTNDAATNLNLRGLTKADISVAAAYYGQVYNSGNPYGLLPTGMHQAFEYTDVGSSLNSETDGYMSYRLAADTGYHYANYTATMAQRTYHSHLRREAIIQIPEISLIDLTAGNLQNYIYACGQIAKKILEAHRTLGGQTEITLTNVTLPFWGMQYDWKNDGAITPAVGGTPTANRLHASPNLFIGRIANLTFRNASGETVDTWGFITGYEFEHIGGGMIKANITISQNPYASQYQQDILADNTRRLNRR